MLLIAVLLLRLSRFSELAGCKVSYDCLQHHHHPWHHRHRRQHDQHAVHRLIQSDLSPIRPCTTSLPPQPPPRRALPSFSDWDDLPLEEFRWPQHDVIHKLDERSTFIKKLSLLPLLFLIDGITHSSHRRLAFPPSLCVLLHRLAASNPVAPSIRQRCSQSINVMHYDDFANVRGVQLYDMKLIRIHGNLCYTLEILTSQMMIIMKPWLSWGVAV